MRRGGGVSWGACLLGLWMVACSTTVSSQEDPENAPSRSQCQPMTCESQGASCGVTIDGCGGTLHCGECTAPETCGGGGIPHVCGQALCTPATCSSWGKRCGAVPDGCGGMLDCGTCPPPPKEPERTCRPLSCGLLGKNCGSVPDGCGGLLECGTCAEREKCGASGVSGVCYTSEPVCVDQDLGRALPVAVKGTTAFGNNDHQASCGGSQAPDRGFLWTAPRSGTFIFDTARSALRSLVAVRRGGCEGEELACATGNLPDGGGASVSVPLEAGQTVLVVVDSEGDGAFSAGHFELQIDEKRENEAGACFDLLDNDMDGWVDCADTDCQGEPGCAGSGCADEDLGSALPVTTHGETVDSGDDFQSACGMQLQQDRGHLWTAPKSGTFVFDTAGSDWSHALSVRTSCRGPELACTVGLAGSRQATVTLTLAQGQTVLVVVDGVTNGDFEEPIRYTLHISEYAPTETGLCADGADNDGDGAADQRDTDCR